MALATLDRPVRQRGHDPTLRMEQPTATGLCALEHLERAAACGSGLHPRRIGIAIGNRSHKSSPLLSRQRRFRILRLPRLETRRLLRPRPFNPDRRGRARPPTWRFHPRPLCRARRQNHLAGDSSASRLGRVGENCRRLGITIVATLACDGARPDACLRGSTFDRVLVDAPCSNTGVLRRRPDLRWRLTPDEITRLVATQRRLLSAAAQRVRPGGVLVYSTCSLEPEENDQVAVDLPGFTRETQRATFPPRDNMDGAFVVRWVRR